MNGKLMLVASMAIVAGMVTLPCGGGSGGDKAPSQEAGTKSGAPVGSTVPVAKADASWPTLPFGEGGTIQVPPAWPAVAVDDRTLELRPPGSNPVEAGPLITVTFHPNAAFRMDGSVPARQTAPQPIEVGGLQGRSYADAEAAVPHHGYTIELPWHGGTLEFFAVSGPAVNLVPQLEEILKTVKLP